MTLGSVVTSLLIILTIAPNPASFIEILNNDAESSSRAFMINNSGDDATNISFSLKSY